MKKTFIVIILVIGVSILSFFIYWNLPVNITYHSDIKFGNALIKNIEQYKKENIRLPKNYDWATFKKLGFKELGEETVPEYATDNKGNFELVYVKGFDGPYLMWNTFGKKWEIGFPKIIAETPKVNNVVRNDTIKLNGKHVIFLRPSKATFDSLKSEPGLYETDSDFGIAIQKTIKDLKSNPKLKTIKGTITTKKYIFIDDCKHCPKTLNRDTIFYGLILTRPNDKIKIITNIRTTSYISEITNYFR